MPQPSASPVPSRALASAALAGLLSAATPACNGSNTDGATQIPQGPSCCAAGAGGSANGGGMSNSGGTSSSGGATSSGGTSPGAGGATENAGGTTSDAGARNTGGSNGTDGGSLFPPPPDAGTNCVMMDGSPPYVTSTKVIPNVTEEQFTAACNARHGTVEIPPHCGGFNTCMGFSWWADTGELTEHTCRGMSSCVGYSCVVCPPAN